MSAIGSRWDVARDGQTEWHLCAFGTAGLRPYVLFALRGVRGSSGHRAWPLSFGVTGGRLGWLRKAFNKADEETIEG